MTFDTFDQSDEETWPDQQKDNDKDKDNLENALKEQPKRLVAFETFDQRQWQRHLEKTLKERPKRPVTFETFNQSDEETRPVQQKDNVKDI